MLSDSKRTINSITPIYRPTLVMIVGSLSHTPSSRKACAILAHHACHPPAASLSPVFCGLCALRPYRAEQKTDIVSAGFGGSFRRFCPACGVHRVTRQGRSLSSLNPAVRGVLVFRSAGHAGFSDRLREVPHRSVERF